uniref:Uncharacterized protein n=1 Tax=Oryza glumipatula TaxID=40148 RepID=A0A0E0ABB3_9ORYZ
MSNRACWSWANSGDIPFNTRGSGENNLAKPMIQRKDRICYGSQPELLLCNAKQQLMKLAWKSGRTRELANQATIHTSNMPILMLRCNYIFLEKKLKKIYVSKIYFLMIYAIEF